VYKTLGFKWLNQADCPASPFVSSDRNEARTPQRFIHANVVQHIMKSFHHLLTLLILIICSRGFGQINSDSTCLSHITDSITSNYFVDKVFVKLNGRLLTNGQEYCFSTKSINSIDIYKTMNMDFPDRIETVTIDLKISQDFDKLRPKYYLFVDSWPEYTDGMNWLHKFIGDNFEYPPIDAYGKIYIQFTVTESGKLNDVKIARGLQNLFDKELLRVFSIMPDWKPGKIDGKPVPVRLTLPVDITLR
jgi:hypothetical protein